MSELTGHQIKTLIEEAMDGVPLGQGRTIAWVSTITGLSEGTITAFLILGSGRGGNYRLGYVDGHRGLKRIETVQ